MAASFPDKPGWIWLDDDPVRLQFDDQDCLVVVGHECGAGDPYMTQWPENE